VKSSLIQGFARIGMSESFIGIRFDIPSADSNVLASVTGVSGYPILNPALRK